MLTLCYGTWVRMRSNLIWVLLVLAVVPLGISMMLPPRRPTVEKQIDFMYTQPVSYQRTWWTYLFLVDGKNWHAQLVAPDRGEAEREIVHAEGTLPKGTTVQQLRELLNAEWGKLKRIEARQQPEDPSMSFNLRIGEEINVWMDPRSPLGRKVQELYEGTFIGEQRRKLMER